MLQGLAGAHCFCIHCNCTIRYKGPKDGLEIFGQDDGLVEFYDFMAGFNDRIIEFMGGELMAKPVENRLPKALVWYYGVDSLVVRRKQWK